MAKEVPFHSTFTTGFLDEAESEARTAICTKLGLEQLTQEPNFTAKLWSIRVRKFFADKFFPATEDEEEKMRYVGKKPSLGVYYKLVSFLFLVLLFWVARQPALDGPLRWVRGGLFGRVGSTISGSFAKDDFKSSADKLPSKPVVPGITPSLPGWCLPVHLWATQPYCGEHAGQWDPAPRSVQRRPSTKASLADSVVLELAATVQGIADAMPQQEQVFDYIYHAVNGVMDDVNDIKAQLKAQPLQPAPSLKAEEASLTTLSPLATNPVVTVAMSVVLCLMIMMGVSMRQNSRHNADMMKVMQQCQQLHEQVVALRAMPEQLKDIENQVSRQQHLAAEARADNHQLHEDLREKLDESVQDMNMNQTQLAAQLAALTGDIRFLKSEAHAEMAHFREAIGQLEVEREALHSEIEDREQQLSEGQRQLELCEEELQETNKKLADTANKLQVREEGLAEITVLMHDLQDELHRADDALADKTKKEQELLDQLEEEMKARIANEGYVDILRAQHDILSKAVVSMNEYLDADEEMRLALEGRVADLETERDTLLSQLSQSREAEQQAMSNAERYKREVTEKEKLLHYRKYEMEMLMKMARENNGTKSPAPMSAN